MNQLKSSEEITELLQQAEKNNQSCCLVFLSIDDLHQVNRKYGHKIGDRVLQKWGRLLQAAFRNHAILGYWGYGEFAIATTSLNQIEMSDRLTEIMTTLRKQIFIATDGTRFSVSCNHALVEYPTDGNTVQGLYQKSWVYLSPLTSN